MMEAQQDNLLEEYTNYRISEAGRPKVCRPPHITARKIAIAP